MKEIKIITSEFEKLARYFSELLRERNEFVEEINKYANLEPQRKLESEGKSMLHNVTVKHEGSKVLEEFWVMKAERTTETVPGGVRKEWKEQELEHEPTPDEIAQFLSDSKADFVSVLQNYRFENELPFC